MVAISCNVTRIFYAVLTKGVDYDWGKMILNICHERVEAIYMLAQMYECGVGVTKDMKHAVELY